MSDHGQSQGATFLQRYGQSLEQLVEDLMGAAEGAAAATENVEAWGPVNVLLGQVSQQGSVTGRLHRTSGAQTRRTQCSGPDSV